MEEEIDLRPYIEALLRHRYWIVGVVVLTAGITFLGTRFIPSIYEAKSSIAIIRSRTDVSFDSRIQTLSEGELNTLNADSRSRRDALIGLVKSNAVAGQVLSEVSDLMLENERSISALLELVEVESEGDLIHILVQYQDAKIVAQIANVWAQSFEQITNELYSTSEDTNLALIMSQIETAETAYEAAQQDVEIFTRDNEVELLRREIDASQEILDAYQEVRNSIQSGAIELQSDNQQATLAVYYDDLTQVELWLIESEALREQVGTGQNSNTEKLANALAFISLQSEIFGGDVPIELQVNFDEPGSGIGLGEVDTLIDVLKRRHETTNGHIEQLYSELLITNVDDTILGSEHPLNVRIRATNETLRALEAQKQAEEAQRQKLERSRDLAWETYQTLLRKQAEVEIASQTSSSEVRWASPAVQPEEPVGRGTLLTLLVVVASSFSLMVLIIFAQEWWSLEFNESSTKSDD